jgi:hypothetical protein
MIIFISARKPAVAAEAFQEEVADAISEAAI